jgi:hypothetical protein
MAGLVVLAIVVSGLLTVGSSLYGEGTACRNSFA